MTPKRPAYSLIVWLAVAQTVLGAILEAYGDLMGPDVTPWLVRTATILLPGLVLAARLFRQNGPTTLARPRVPTAVSAVLAVLAFGILIVACSTTATFQAETSMEWRPTVGPPGRAVLTVDGVKVCEATSPGKLAITVDDCAKVATARGQCVNP